MYRTKGIEANLTFDFLGALIEIAKKVGLEVEAASYSRQRFHFPDKQPFPHQSFADEVSVLCVELFWTKLCLLFFSFIL